MLLFIFHLRCSELCSFAYVATVEDSFWVVGIGSLLIVVVVICKAGRPKDNETKTVKAYLKDPVYSGF